MKSTWKKVLFLPLYYHFISFSPSTDWKRNQITSLNLLLILCVNCFISVPIKMCPVLPVFFLSLKKTNKQKTKQKQKLKDRSVEGGLSFLCLCVCTMPWSSCCSFLCVSALMMADKASSSCFQWNIKANTESKQGLCL